jgi:hypothetical protein
VAASQQLYCSFGGTPVLIRALHFQQVCEADGAFGYKQAILSPVAAGYCAAAFSILAASWLRATPIERGKWGNLVSSQLFDGNLPPEDARANMAGAQQTTC